MAKYFKHHLEAENNSIPGDPYVWCYGRDCSDHKEDISHGAIDVDFARLCAENGIVFDNTDMNRFAETFKEKLHSSHGEFGELVSGQEHPTKDWRKWAAGRWLFLTPYDQFVYTSVSQLVTKYLFCDRPQDCILGERVKDVSLLSLSYLVRYKEPNCFSYSSLANSINDRIFVPTFQKDK